MKMLCDMDNWLLPRIMILLQWIEALIDMGGKMRWEKLDTNNSGMLLSCLSGTYLIIIDHARKRDKIKTQNVSDEIKTTRNFNKLKLVH